MIEIRSAKESDITPMIGIFRQVVVGGDTYVFLPDASEEDARSYWWSPDFKVFVALDEGQVVGMYKLRANNIGLGAHVANASFMVDPMARGKGVGRLMGEHCLDMARRDGFQAMQFNFVVSTNTSAVELWKRLGFEIVGTLPKAFNHVRLGLVDAYVMHRFLEA
jgi:L-amino acid N-acyltransferase YncA